MSHLKKVEISYYRSYETPQTLQMAIPNGKNGSGLTVVVGPNNAGKTTLLEAITLTTEKRVADHERVGSFEPKIEFTLESGDVKTLTTPQTNSAQLVGDFFPFYPVPSRRFWNAKDSNTLNIDQTFEKGKKSEKLRGPSSGFSVASILKTIESKKDERDRFTSQLQEIFPNFTKWYVGFDGDNDYIGYETKAGAKHRADFLGDGVGSVFRIIAHVQQSKTPLVIDEPELSLQPDAQKKLLRVIAEESKDRQILIATHSPYFIDFDHFGNGAKYARVNKHDDKESMIYQLGEYSKYQSLFNGSTWEMPFLYDEVAKEIFFQDKILFLEGQQDVGLIKKYYKEKDEFPNFNFFGYGVRGFSNFKLALTFSRDLGLQKVACIIDKGTAEDTALADLKRLFNKEEYRFKQWSKADIRDKVCCEGCGDPECIVCKYHRVQKDGLFDQDGILKQESIGEFTKTVDEIKTYFSDD